MKEYVLKMEGINKSFSGVHVLKDVNLYVEKGHVHALAGCNGAGKSCMMKIMTGVYTKDSGTIEFEGKERSFANYSDASNVGIRMIFQELSVVPTLTVAENIYLNHEYKKNGFIDKKRMEQEASALLNDFGLSIPSNVVVEDLPVGQQQLVEVVKAISMNAKLLIMDEPTSSLSTTEVEHLFGLIRKLKEQGVSIIYISHRMSEVLEICDDITVMRNGEAVITKQIKDTSIEEIVQYMLGDKQANSFTYHKREMGEAIPMLTVNNLSIDGLVDHISFTLYKGEVLGIAGLMGSGRTETLETLFGMRKGNKDLQLIMDGQEITIDSPLDAMKYGINLVPEDRKRKGLVVEDTLLENVRLTILDKARTKSKIFLSEKIPKKFAKHDIDTYGIVTDSIHKTVSELSGGNQQKIVLSKWINRSPRVLLLDEPTVGVDVAAKGDIIKVIVDYVQEGNSVILVSSEMEELMAACDRIIVLNHGAIASEVKREDIKDEGVLQNAIQGKAS